MADSLSFLRLQKPCTKHSLREEGENPNFGKGREGILKLRVSSDQKGIIIVVINCNFVESYFTFGSLTN
jgi:hypothetical protein